MLRRLIVSTLVALCLASGVQTAVAAKQPSLVVCETPSMTLSILIGKIKGNFRNLNQAVRHCEGFMNGQVVAIVD